MSEKVPPRVLFEFGSDEPVELPAHLGGGEEEEFESYEDEEASSIPEIEEIPEGLPEIVEKPKPVKEDIFDLPNLGVMPEKVKEDLKYEGMEDGLDYLQEKPKPKPKPVKQKKPRKPMTEEHKAKLAIAREKAMLVRKQKAEEKKKMKALDNEEKELLKKQKYKKVQKLKEEVDEEEVPKTPKNSPPAQTGFSKKDLEDAQYDAIIKYETLRKQRKAEKKKKEALEKSKQELVQKLKPQGYQYRDGSNSWDSFY